MAVEFVVSGFVVGVLVGFTGMGGGSLMTGLLVLIFGVHPVAAVGTDLMFAAITKTVGARVHARKGNVSWPTVGLLALGSIPTTILILLLMSRLPIHEPAVARVLKIAIGAGLFVAGLNLLLSGPMRLVAGDDESATASSARPFYWTTVLGALLGLVVSATSVGAGALGIVVMRHLYPRMPSVTLVGSDIAHAVGLTLVGGMGYWLMGEVDAHMLGLLLLGSIPGIIVGSTYAHTVPDYVLRTVLGGVLVVVAGSLVYAGLG